MASKIFPSSVKKEDDTRQPTNASAVRHVSDGVPPRRIWRRAPSLRTQNVTSHIQHHAVSRPLHLLGSLSVCVDPLCYPPGVFPFFCLSLLSRTAYAPIYRICSPKWWSSMRLCRRRFRLMWFVQLHIERILYPGVRSGSTRGEKSLNIGSLRTPA